MNAAIQPQRRSDAAVEDAGPDRHAFEQIVARTSEAVLLIDAVSPDRPVVYANPAFEALTGFTCGEIVGRPWRALSRRSESADALRSAIERSVSVDVVLDDARKDGRPWQSRVSCSPLNDASGGPRYFLILQREPANPDAGSGNGEVPVLRHEAGRSRQKIDSMNRTDLVTGLLRYEYFVDILSRDLAVARRDRRAVTVMVFDIVELEVYSNTFGSKAAESCVRMIAAQITGTMRRAGDLCARCGDTLIAASVLGQEPAEAEVLIGKITANVRGLKLHNPRATSGRYVGVAAASVGGVPGPDDDAETMLERALLRLRAKTHAAGPSTVASGSYGSTVTSTPKYGWSK